MGEGRAVIAVVLGHMTSETGMCIESPQIPISSAHLRRCIALRMAAQWVTLCNLDGGRKIHLSSSHYL